MLEEAEIEVIERRTNDLRQVKRAGYNREHRNGQLRYLQKEKIMATKSKRREKREKNKLRLRYLWPRMTKEERKDVCKQTLPGHLLSVHPWERPWIRIPMDWQSLIGMAHIPRHAGLEIAERHGGIME
jgi:hypothetical protein